MPRQFRARERRSGFRDARLIVIACEGQKTEPNYFKGLLSTPAYANPRAHVEILQREEEELTHSAPQHVLKMLDAFKKEYALDENDEMWLVIDADHWAEKLSDIAQTCLQKNYQLAVSNPCFELWLLLHVQPLEAYSAGEQQELLRNFREGKRPKIQVEIVKQVHSYNKSDMSPFLPHVHLACQRARAGDVNPAERWPNGLGSRVYRLVEAIIGQDKLTK